LKGTESDVQSAYKEKRFGLRTVRKGPGKDGQGAQGFPEYTEGGCRRFELHPKAHAAKSAEERKGGHPAQGVSYSRFQSDGGLQTLQQALARGIQRREGRTPDSRLQELRRASGYVRARRRGLKGQIMSRLREFYKTDALPALVKQFGYKNVMAVPKLVKINVNMGLGEAISNAKVLDVATDEVSTITGQRPIVTKAKKSIAAFKLRQGMPIGVTVTLRGDRMYEFFDRLVSIALPRVRDFRGVSPKSFDGRGNYTLGLRDQLIFPEIDYAKADKARGMNVTIVTTAKTDDEAYELLRIMGMPFAKTGQQ
jgi:large subunit ribosomal protein L5